MFYQVSAKSIVDYFQMDDTTLCGCLSLTNGMGLCDVFAKIYLRKPTISDAWNIVETHTDVIKFPEMMGSLDVTKVYWKNCPTAWKG